MMPARDRLRKLQAKLGLTRLTHKGAPYLRQKLGLISAFYYAADSTAQLVFCCQMRDLGACLASIKTPYIETPYPSTKHPSRGYSSP